jgi:hypothetical protein
MCEAQCWRNSSLWVESSPTGDEVLVVWVASCFEPEHGGGVGGHAVVVDEELSGGRVEVDEPGGVGGAFCCRAGDGGVQDRRVERAGERVHGEDVVPGVADPGRRFGDRVENLLDDWANRGRAGSGAARRGWTGGAG